MSGTIIILSLAGGMLGGLVALLLGRNLDKTPAVILAMVLTLVGYVSVLGLDAAGFLSDMKAQKSAPEADWSQALSDMEKSNPRLALLKQYDPAVYDVFKNQIITHLNNGVPQADIQNGLPASFEAASRRKIVQSPDALIIRDIEIARDTYMALRESAPAACRAMLNGAAIPNLLSALPADLRSRKAQQINDVLASRPQDEYLLVTDEKFAEIRDGLRADLTAEYGDFSSDATDAADDPDTERQTCDRGQDFFQAVLELDAEVRVPFARKLISQ